MSLQLGGIAMLVAVLGGVMLGSLAALRQNKPTDYAVMAVAMTGISVPNFVLAPLLVLVFAVYLGWLPAGGLGEAASGMAAGRIWCCRSSRSRCRRWPTSPGSPAAA